MNNPSGPGRRPPARRASEPAAERRPGFRPDIEGLRALAVVSVILWHANVPGASGGYVGVDVFFVVSGYLMTLILTRELAATGRISLPRFYARRARRLLPAACLTIAATVVATRLVDDATRWSVVAKDAIWATLYGANWHFIDERTAYMGGEQPPSPLQHFWSLSVEEQFYAVFPIALVASFALWRAVTRRRGSDARRARASSLGLVVVVAATSLAYCLVDTPAHPDSAYFSSFTRAWELALGGIVALTARSPLAPGRRAQRGLQVVAAASLAMIVATVALLPEGVPFPGWRALLATVPTAALIAVGGRGADGPLTRLLSRRPLIWIGGLSYSLYLWHWPVFVLGGRILGFAPRERTWHITWLVGLTVVLAWLSYTLVENPVRRRGGSPRRVFVAAGVVSALTVAAAGAVIAESVLRDHLAQRRIERALGANIIPLHPPPAYDPAIATLQPVAVQDPVTLHQSSLPRYWRNACFADADRMEACPFGDPSSRRVVYLIGDSTAGMWEEAVEQSAPTLGIRGALVIRHYCGFADTTLMHDGRPNTDCREWGRRVLRRLLDDPPDAVILPMPALYVAALPDGTAASGRVSRDLVAQGLARTWNALLNRGVDVYVIPALGSLRAGLECAVDHGGDGRSCGVPRERFTHGARALQAAATRLAPRVRVVDMLAVVCPASTCPAVVGGLFVAHDPWHLSSHFARSLGPHLTARMQAAAPDTDPIRRVGGGARTPVNHRPIVGGSVPVR